MPRREQISGSLADWVDEVATQFDAAWRSGAPPRIADYLMGDAVKERRAALLQELVKLDLEYRYRSGEDRKLDDYARELPELLGPDLAIPDDLVLYARQARERFCQK